MLSNHFAFLVPVIGQRAAKDWPLVIELLRKTVLSLLGQNDEKIGVYCVCNEDIELNEFRDERVRFYKLSYPKAFDPSTYMMRQADIGQKRRFMRRAAYEAGFGYLMDFDSDDLAYPDLVDTCKAALNTASVGVFTSGWAFDARSGNAILFPEELNLSGHSFPPFFRYCGSSCVMRTDHQVKNIGLSLPEIEFINERGHLNVYQRSITLCKATEKLSMPKVIYQLNNGQNVSLLSLKDSDNDKGWRDWQKIILDGINSIGRPMKDNLRNVKIGL